MANANRAWLGMASISVSLTLALCLLRRLLEHPSAMR